MLYRLLGNIAERIISPNNILMQPSVGKLASPERSRSIKLKVSNKIFPQDFFHRSSSQSPIKPNNNMRYLQRVPEPMRNSDSVKNELYWDSMREELQQCKDLSKKDRIKQIQRIWVYSEKKNRPKPGNEQRIRFESRQQNRKLAREDSELAQHQLKNKFEFDGGLFTFFAKSPTKGLNLMLPPIK